MSDFNAPFTPERLTEDAITLSIPVYQRLFVWGEEQITRLLEDFLTASRNNEHYYIGAITVWQKTEGGNTWEIVDGQQRLTFLSLLFAVGKALCPNTCKEWTRFNHPDGSTDFRIRYKGRSADKAGLENLEGGKTLESVNGYFAAFRGCFLKFGASFDVDLDAYLQYVYEHAAFLVVKLPGNYTTHDLNLYFEKMNSTGRQIAPVDEVRGMLLLNESELEIWNACMDFSGSYQAPQEKQQGQLSVDDYTGSLAGFLLDDAHVAKGDPDATDERMRQHFERSILSPELFLAHALALTMSETDACPGSGDPTKIIELFRQNGPGLSKSRLLERMVSYRKWLDEHIICVEGKGESGDKYKFREDGATDDDSNRTMLLLQEFLHVASGEKQEWVLKAYWESRKQGGRLSVEDLETADNERNPLPPGISDSATPKELSYQAHNRYWFYKLDYLLWKQRKKWVVDQKWQEAAENFVFRSGMTIEHLHPQNPEHESWAKEDRERSLDAFGNLALLEQSSNSSLSNLPVGQKFARIQDRLALGKGLESLKLLKMGMAADFQEVNWTAKNADDHGQAMIKVLREGYGLAVSQADGP